MPKPKSTNSRTFVCHGRLHRNTNAPAVLANRRVSAGILFDATLDQLNAHHAGHALSGNQAQKLTTVVANQLGIQRGPLNNRARIAIVGNAVNAWNNHVNHDAGLPKKYAGLPVKTIETFANGERLKKPLVTFNRNGNAALRFPGHPTDLLPAFTRRPAHLLLRLRSRKAGQGGTHLPHPAATPATRRPVEPLRRTRHRPRRLRAHRHQRWPLSPRHQPAETTGPNQKGLPSTERDGPQGHQSGTGRLPPRTRRGQPPTQNRARHPKEVSTLDQGQADERIPQSDQVRIPPAEAAHAAKESLPAPGICRHRQALCRPRHPADCPRTTTYPQPEQVSQGHY